ncbi:MAG: sulfate adenylyltransferase subunit 1, partial [Lachnospira sp.]
MAEREQGITIDVAYRYFTTDNRSFIVADTPGHEEYTRNMAVGASFADLAVILVDAKQGVLVQTRRHARICALMGIRYFVFAVNKMDLVGYDEKVFAKIQEQIAELTKELDLQNVTIIPVSATEGDNVTVKSPNMPWYNGQALLSYLEQVDITAAAKEQGFYMPVQRVCRPNHEFRGFQGQIEAGNIHVGDAITTLPSNEQAHVKSIHVGDKNVDAAQEGQPVTIQLDREVDVSRGCVLSVDSGIKTAAAVTATILWMDDDALENGKNFFIKLGTKMIPGLVTKIVSLIDVNTGEKKEVSSLHKNEIAVCEIAFADRIVADTFAAHKTLGELILIDRVTNMTSACGVVTELHADEDGLEEKKVNKKLRSALNGQSAVTVEFPVGQHGITLELAEQVEKQLSAEGRHTYLYAPEADEPVETVLQHLTEAGVVVLLVLDEAFVGKTFAQDDKTYYRNWQPDGTLTVSEAAEFVKKVSSYAAGVSVHGDFI